MSERKRKHKALSGENADVERKVITCTPKTDSNRSSPVVANTPTQVDTASAKLPSADMKSHESSCETLPPGIIAKIGTYIKLSVYGSDNDKKALMSFCSAVGPHVSSYIRKAYLENNLSYLEYLEDVLFSLDRDERFLNDAECALLGEKLRQWILYNPWWKKACRSPAKINASKEDGEFPPTICKVIRVKAFSQDKLDSLGQEGELGMNPSGLITLPLSLLENAARDKPLENDEYNVALSVNGTDLTHNAVAFEEAMVASGNVKEIVVMHEYFSIFFFNPALSVNFGIFDLLRFQLEDLELDVNAEWVGPRFREIEIPLILYSMVQTDARMFEYLLQFNGIRLNPTVSRCPITEMLMPDSLKLTMLHFLSPIVGLIFEGNFNFGRLKTLLSQESVDVNTRLVINDQRSSPLFFLICSPVKYESDIDIVRVFAEAGADIECTRPFISAASLANYSSTLQQFLDAVRPSFRERFQSVAKEMTSELMVSRHKRLVELLRLLFDERAKKVCTIR